MIALDLNDSGLVAARQADGRLIALEADTLFSPGLALPRADGLIVGLAAWRQARLHPTRIIADAWDRLDLTPYARPLPGARHAADIALAHLDAIRKRLGLEALPLVLAVPAHWSRDALGVLLGVTQSLRLNVRGLVDAGLAALPRLRGTAHALFLDGLLNRFTATLYVREEESVRRLDAVSAPAAGTWAIQQTLLQGVSREFVRQTRFDPAHRADTEQWLFDRLPALLGTLSAEEEESLTLPHGDREVRAVLRAASLAQMIAPAVHAALAAAQDLLLRRQVAGLPLEVFATHRLALVPGLGEALQALGDIRLHWLPEGAAARGACAFATVDPAAGLKLVTRREWAPAAPALPPVAASTSETPAQPGPTHLLLGAVAFPLGETPLFLAFRRPEVGSAGSGWERVDTPPSEGLSVQLAAGGTRLQALGSGVHAAVNGVGQAGEAQAGLGDRIGLVGVDAEARLIRCEPPP
jgi:hypothetical protein